MGASRCYICVGKCPELDYDNSPRCRCIDPETAFDQYPDGCPCGNEPNWISMEEYENGKQ